MRIGIVCHPTFGGSGVLATELAAYLARQGHSVHVISYAMPARMDVFQPDLYFHEVQVQDYPLFQYQPYELALSSMMVQVVQREKLDLLHVHYAIPHAYAAYMARKILEDQGVTVPVVTTLHGTDITLVGKHPSYKPAVCFSIEHSSAVTAVSESLRRDTERIFNIRKRIRVIPNFVDLERYGRCTTDTRAKVAPDDVPILVHVSNFRKVKRVQDVVDVFARVRSQIPVRLVLVGDGPERQRAESDIEQRGLHDDVRWMGKSTDVERILSMSDVFLLPSESESFGLAALEAMASYVPVVATRAGGIPEVIDHGQCGFLEAVGDTEAMAADVLRILTTPGLRETMGQAARAKAEAFAMANVGSQYIDLYQKLLDEQAR
ncbi:MAG: N-acetyl-alpha-D-glucosaminyl L-malate synthase BshA [Schleiferiaceae bacterium]|jgi:N-acetyl-alpha-D-glucosaminyl L-malate synthase BshA